MTHASFVEGDTGSKLRITCKDEDSGAIIDLTGSTVKLRWRTSGGALIIKTMTIVPPTTNGIAEYLFLADELESILMRFEVEITNAGGDILTNIDPLYEPVRKRLSA